MEVTPAQPENQNGGTLTGGHCTSFQTFSGNIWLSKFQCLSEDVEHQWTCCHYVRKLQLVFLRSFQAPCEALLQTSSLKQDPSHPGQWPDSLAEFHVSFPLALWAMSHPYGSSDSQLLSKSPGMSFPPLMTPTVHPARMNTSPLAFLTLLFAVYGVSFIPLPHHTVFQMLSWTTAASACFSQKKSKPCPSVATLMACPPRLAHGLTINKSRYRCALRTICAYENEIR